MKSTTMKCAARAALAAACLFSACAAGAIDLLSVYRLAREADPLFEASRHALAAGRERLPQARAVVLPSLNLTAGGDRQDGQSSFVGSGFMDRSVDSHNWHLQLSVPLLRASGWIGVGEARAQVQQAEVQFEQAEQDLMLRTCQAYFDVLNARDSVRVAEAQLKAVAEQLETARHRHKVGDATITDVHEARSRHDLARSQLVQALNDEEVKLAELERIVGPLAEPLAVLRRELALPQPEPADVGAWMDGAREHNPAVRERVAAAEAAQQAIGRERAAHLPTLDLTAGYGHSFSSGSMSSPADVENRVKASTVGLQLTVPLYAGGGINSRVVEAVANQQRARAELDAARRQAAAQARQAYTGVTSGLSQVDALTSAVASSEDAVQANRIGYRIGTRIGIDVLNAEQQLYAAERDLAKARYDTIVQGMRLKAAAGLLAEADVAQVSALLSEDRLGQARGSTTISSTGQPDVSP